MPEENPFGNKGGRLFGLIGYPLSHSFSKKYFTEKFEKEGRTDCRYELFEIKSVNELKDIIKKHPELEGINVTVPFKQLVLPLLHTTHIPGDLKACNCIKISHGLLGGYNTDITGFEKSLTPLLKEWHRKALVLGNGGSASAVRFVLKKLNIECNMVSREPHDGSTLSYENLDEKVIMDHSIIINTTPLGMYPKTGECPSIPYEFITPDHLLYDLIYNPAKTLFLQKGEARGATIKNGEEMLIIQAEESWKVWNDGEIENRKSKIEN